MAEIDISGDWRPRPYQEAIWSYLWPNWKSTNVDERCVRGGNHAEMIWHRRAGKDDVALRHAAKCMVLEPANYWHMLPQHHQVRKAIWTAVNSHTGKRRIDETFPDELFDKRETDMFVRCRINESTWQCLGSDNYQGAIGSGVKGIVYSEWPQANPSARGYLRPMIRESNGWQIFVGTPRGKNHGHSTLISAQKNPKAFAQILTIHDTGALTGQQILEELHEYVDTYGEAMGLSLFEQEYECSFDAAILGAYFGEEFRKIDHDGRIASVPHDKNYPVHVAMDIGYDDDTAIWWFQVAGGEVRVLDYYFNSNKDPDHYASVILGRDVEIDIISGKKVTAKVGAPNDWARNAEYAYGSINLPHDAKAKTLAAKGKSIEEQFASVFGWGKVKIVPGLSITDGITAARQVLRRCWIDEKCLDGTEAMRQYHREWDDNKKMFKDKPDHDWTSHAADGFRYLAVCLQEDTLPREAEETKWQQHRTFDEMVQERTQRRKRVH